MIRHRDPARRRLGIAALSALLALSACGQYSKHRDPQLSGVVLDGETMPEVNRISVPMPDVEPAMPPKRAEASGLWGKNTRSFFGDRRAQAVGDLLTVVIDIDDQAQLKNASERSRTGGQTAADPVFLGYGGQISKILPGVDENDLPTGGNIIDLDSASSSSGEGSIKRNETIELRVAAMIVKELPNGNFIIGGRQEVKVNYELRELRVAGVIRPVDINIDNTISYDQIAEARIAYGGRGQLSRVQQPRYGEDMLDVVLPY
ncbi:flagellar basal body L-ring protein FlgH [Pseudodonghicola flavimaris]|uniref:Flagellar L-ring protein n=1 Tax=Pseudodonghicola flavimaris TaxID=3050036 RepID=A0ABT7EWK5_9RHOB|nr:flagellar basal body L-ring protein FlgH [Pseudodonghicola flavimaris]MDK3016727.1 flagellar basal body L-ring protein FlgH [Pseudodonghicola flavimaris]